MTPRSSKSSITTLDVKHGKMEFVPNAQADFILMIMEFAARSNPNAKFSTKL
jgi:hypothetical protein